MDLNERKKRNVKWTAVVVGIFLAANILLARLLMQNMKELEPWEAQFSQTTSASEETAEEISILLPETVYAVDGITMEIYNQQVTNLGADITKYNVCWKCEVGENLERKFSVAANGSNRGSYALTMEIYDNALNLVAQKECVLKIIEGNAAKREAAEEVSSLTEVPQQCMEQVKISVDTEYNGTLEELKPEGVEQMQDVIYAVLSGF